MLLQEKVFKVVVRIGAGMRIQFILRGVSLFFLKMICACVIFLGAALAVDAFVPKSKPVSCFDIILEFICGVVLAGVGMLAAWGIGKCFRKGRRGLST